MKDMWTYDPTKRVDKLGKRWHFVHHSILDDPRPYRERPVEWYFRDDDRRTFGVLRLEHQKDFPYRDYDTMVRTIMNKPLVRAQLIDPSTASVWRKNWK